MAVESRFVVIRHGAEVQTFMDKKSADEYDKMLDMADNLTAMLDATPFDLSDEVKEDLSIYLAQNREDVLIALQAKKAKPASKAAPAQKAPVNVEVEEKAEKSIAETKTTSPAADSVDVVKEKAPTKKAVRKTKSKTASDIANTPTKEAASAES